MRLNGGCPRSPGWFAAPIDTSRGTGGTWAAWSTRPGREGSLGQCQRYATRASVCAGSAGAGAAPVGGDAVAGKAVVGGGGGNVGGGGVDAAASVGAAVDVAPPPVCDDGARPQPAAVV